ncbi:MAG: hypothetical protein ACKOT0_01360, partial [bacterium]
MEDFRGGVGSGQRSAGEEDERSGGHQCRDNPPPAHPPTLAATPAAQVSTAAAPATAAGGAEAAQQVKVSVKTLLAALAVEPEDG